jgi:2,3-diketo-5-methylthio-1-phosphopentane phosphatase
MRYELETFPDLRKIREKYIFYFDFDNTLTSFDVLDDIIMRFSPTDEWMSLEKAWQAKEIGSKSCLIGQMDCVRVAPPKLNEYLRRVKVDPYFKKLLFMLRRKKIETVIVSDSFTYFIRRILRANGIRKMSLCANELKIIEDRMIPSFPHGNMDCPDCAHCKKRHILTSRYEGKKVVYVGDGRSDYCAAMEADLVFAKGVLKGYLRREGKSFVPFRDFKSIFAYAKNLFSHAYSPKKTRRKVKAPVVSAR